MGCAPQGRSMTDSRRCPSAACAEIQMPPASGPRGTIVAVLASIAARSLRRSRPKSTHPVIPHMSLFLQPGNEVRGWLRRYAHAIKDRLSPSSRLPGAAEIMRAMTANDARATGDLVLVVGNRHSWASFPELV